MSTREDLHVLLDRLPDATLPAVARYLANMAGPAGTLLVLDDLQWAGPDALDLLTALVERLPDELIEPAVVVVPGDIAGSLRRLVRELDHRFSRSLGLSHLLWREADTHHVVRDALAERFQVLVRQVRAVILAATGGRLPSADVERASGLLARAVSHRHATARHSDDDLPAEFDGELTFIADALAVSSARASAITLPGRDSGGPAAEAEDGARPS